MPTKRLSGIYICAIVVAGQPRPPRADTLPLLLVLPGLDGSGLTAFMQCVRR